jgi:CDP-6-deoxy-D-xylo-4-hexulose-3-dehydrase
MDSENQANQIKKMTLDYFKSKKFTNKYKVPLAASTIVGEDVVEALDSLLNLKLTMGKKVKKFEEAWAKYNNVKHSILLNSGTSANFLALSALMNPLLKNKMVRGNEVVTSPVTFPSSVFPIAQLGLVPTFVDVNLESMNMDASKIEDALTDNTKAILAVHFMGYPCDMKDIMDIAREHNLFVIEDVCESHGAQVNGKKAGTFGDMGTFSFFFSHHISTIEGGSVITNNDEYAELVHCLKAYGWIRNLRNKEELSKKYGKTVDPRHLYVNLGHNLKPTELTAALGLHQIERIEDIIAHKRKVVEYLNKNLAEFEDLIILPHEKTGTRHTYLGYPIVIRPDAGFNKFDMMNHLENQGIETRQLEAGNMLQQPSIDLYKYRVVGDTKNAEIIMNGGFFIGNHGDIGKEELDYILTVFSSFLKKHK